MAERKKMVIFGPMLPPEVFREIEQSLIRQVEEERVAKEAAGLPAQATASTIEVDVIHYPDGLTSDQTEGGAKASSSTTTGTAAKTGTDDQSVMSKDNKEKN